MLPEGPSPAGALGRAQALDGLRQEELRLRLWADVHPGTEDPLRLRCDESRRHRLTPRVVI